MNLKEAKIMLEKINRLYDSMILDSKIDPFEQELMLSYIKKMYAAFSASGEPLNPVVESRPAPKPKAAIERPAPKVIKRVVAEPPKVVTPAPTPVADPEEVEMIKEAAAEVIPPAPAPTPKPSPKPAPTPPPVVKTAAVDDDVAELFAGDEGKELSDRLASLPIRDLTKAMGLNERILTVNELFGKDQQAFTTSMNIMNTMGNFEEAKVHLAECK